MKKLKNIANNLLAVDVSYELSQELYRKWVLDGSYDKYIKDLTVYTAPPRLTAKMVELFPHPEDALVLDIGAGSGVLGELLLAAGFRLIHALEPLREFVVVAEQKGVYQKVYQECIGLDSSISCYNDMYDAVVATGAFGPGHIPCDSFHEIVRILKPGGYFINCMRHEYLWTSDIYKEKLEPLAEQLVAEGKWEKVMWEPYQNHFMGHEGLMMVFKAL